MSGKTYKLILNEKQMRVIKDVCELRFRIDLCQSGDLSEILAQINTDLSPDNPHHNEIFDRYIDRRDAIHEIVEAIFRISVPFRNTPRKRDKDALICEDLYQSIRYALWQNKPDKEDWEEWTVDSRPPMRISDQPLPEIEVEENATD